MTFTQLDYLIARAFEEAAMKKIGIAVPGFSEKDGKLKRKSRTPKPIAKGKRLKAEREAKAWAKAQRKTT